MIRRYLREDEQLEILIISVRRCAITSCYVINLFFSLVPIGPKRGDEEAKEQDVIKMTGAVWSGLYEGRD